MIAPQVVTSVPTRIHAVRQSASAIAWLDGPCQMVHALVGGRVVRFGSATADCQPYPPLLALNGATPIWAFTYYGNTAYGDVFAGRHQVAEVTGESAIASGDYLTGIAAAGGQAFFAVLAEDASDGCFQSGPCIQTVDEAKSRVMRIGKGLAKVAGLPPAYALAGSADRLALVVAAPEIVRDAAHASGEIDVFTVPGYRQVRSVTVRGKILDVAVSHTGLAVLTPGRIHRFDGKPDLTVPASVRKISLASGHVVYASGRTVRVDGRIVATRPVAPIGVSLLGRRLVWAERHRGGSTVYALRLPR